MLTVAPAEARRVTQLGELSLRSRTSSTMRLRRAAVDGGPLLMKCELCHFSSAIRPSGSISTIFPRVRSLHCPALKPDRIRQFHR
jgi:hypothetical protein